MLDAEYIYGLVSKTKRTIEKCISTEKIEDALSLISICAGILYQTNVYYRDNDLELYLESISEKIKLNEFETEGNYNADDDFLLFYDGFGVNNRGLIQIYLKALCKIKKVVYVTYEDRKDLIPDVLNILDDYKCERRYLNRKKKTNTNIIDQLHKVIKEFRPARFFFYSLPDDVIATPLLYAYKRFLIRYQINLTDHAFWLGAGCIDKCIEFRNYGAKISKEYRYINEEKIVVIPFYPIIHCDREFQGFPFAKSNHQKVVFSGGALYKTFGGDNKYYEIIDHILSANNEVIFWYAGVGDESEMRKIINKYPGRAYLTGERSDLFQVLNHCDVYLSTYPMCGGLMFQYAAMAGCVPVTLKSGNISDDFLINQENINVEFEDLDNLYAEIDRLLSDEAYAKDRNELMKNSVITQDVFEKEIRKLITGSIDYLYKPRFEHIDTKQFRNWYLEGLVKADIDVMLVHRNAIKLGLSYYPFRFLKGGLYGVKRIIKRRLT